MWSHLLLVIPGIVVVVVGFGIVRNLVGTHDSPLWTVFDKVHSGMLMHLGLGFCSLVQSVQLCRRFGTPASSCIGVCQSEAAGCCCPVGCVGKFLCGFRLLRLGGVFGSQSTCVQQCCSIYSCLRIFV